MGSQRFRAEVHMRVRADNQVCEAHGQCTVVDEELFPVDEDGYSLLGGDGAEVPPGKEDVARLGVDSCPVQALKLE
jgi:ferredoxin